MPKIRVPREIQVLAKRAIDYNLSLPISKAEGSAKARQDKTSKAAIAWALWGGTPASRWVKRAIRKLEAE